MLDPQKIKALRLRIASLDESQRSLLRQRLEAQGIDWAQVDPDAGAFNTQPLKAIVRPERLPLSSAQSHVWVLHRLYPELSAYHIPFAWTLTGELDLAALQQAFDQLIARHESLRSVFPEDDNGRPYLKVLPSVVLDLSVFDIQSELESASPTETKGSDPSLGLHPLLQKRAAKLAARPFDLEKGPLLRVDILQTEAQSHVLVVVLHHLIADGWSRGVLVRELAELYSGAKNKTDKPLPPLVIQYVDHVLREEAWRDSDDAEAQLNWWRQRLSGLEPLLLPSDRSIPPGAHFASGMQTQILPQSLNDGLKAVARRHGVTQFMLLLGLFKLLLFRYTGQTDIAVGVPVAGRLNQESAKLIGFFVNTLVMRTRFDDLSQSALADWLTRVKETVAGALEHQAVTFGDVVEACAPQRTAGRNPLFEVMFQAQTDGYRTQNSAMPDVNFSGLSLTQHALPLDQTKFDMSWHLLDRDDGLLLAVEYRQALFDDSRMQRMLDHFRSLLETVASNSDVRLNELNLLNHEERTQVLALGRGKETVSPFEHLPGAFAQQVERTPDAVAVRDASGAVISFRELKERSDQLARQLLKRGITTEQVVGVCLPRSVGLLAALLGVMRAGAAYVPLDPTLPAERLNYLLEDSQCRVLISDSSTLERAFPVFDKQTSACDYMDVTEAGDPSALASIVLPTISPDQLAYMIYTSGSTGRPKGTLLSHRGLAHYLHWCLQAYPLQQGSGAPVHSSIGFDATITGLFAPLLSGRTVSMLSDQDELESLATELGKAPSLVKLTPAHLQALPPLLTQTIETGDQPGAFIIGGEALTSQHTAYWLEHYPDIALLNEYGPTETVVGCCVHQATQDDGDTIPIGRPIDGVQLYVLDERLEPQPIGVPGELYIAGPGVARGYLGRAALTAERFIPNPFAQSKTEDTLYKTGDLAAIREDGVLLYFGRRDEQLQLHGYRIEPGEVENRLAEHPQIDAAAVAVRKPAGHEQLAAFVCCAPDTGFDEGSLANELRNWLSDSLPDYMLPAHFRVVDHLPLTVNGKLDRAALPDIELQAKQGEALAPRNETETALLAVWQQALNKEVIGVEDNFFEHGGDSITGMQIVALARKAGLKLTPAQLFQHQTIASQAEVATPFEADTIRYQALPEGAIPLAPIQWELFTALEETGDHSHYNQGFLLRVTKALNLDSLKEACQILINHHDGLRLAFEQNSETGQWQQRYSPESEGFESSLNLNVASTVITANQPLDKTLADIITQEQQSFVLNQAPLLRVLHIQTPEQEDRLLLLAHHLVVDALSWRVLIGDLYLLYGLHQAGKPLSLPEKSASYGAWVEHLQQQDTRFEKEVDYWRKTCATTPTLPRDGHSPDSSNKVGDTDTIKVTLTAELSQRLLESDIGKTAHGIDAMLLTSLAQTIGQWANIDALAVDIEGHGRHAWDDAIDLSRTVGWFTCSYPLRIALQAGRRDGQLGAVRDSLAATPNHGIGYGLLRQQGQYELASPAELSLNYLGRIDELALGKTQENDAFIGLDSTPLPALNAASNPRSHLIEQVAWIEAGQLCLLWRFNPNHHQEHTIQRLAQRQLALFESLLLVETQGQQMAQKGHSQQPKSTDTPQTATQNRPIDNTQSGVDQESLKTLLARVGARKK